METIQQMTIGKMVTNSFPVAPIFQSFGIDLGRNIETAKERIKINANEVNTAIEKAIKTVNKERMDFNFWSIDVLADYIEKKHHLYVEHRIPLLLRYLERVCKLHGDIHPELLEIKRLFHESAKGLTVNMRKEEQILFPYFRKMLKKLKAGSLKAEFPTIRSVINPIKLMMEEHENESERFAKIAALSDNYTPPNDACNTYCLTLALLDEFEKDLHQHIHLENDILFPKSMQHEDELNGSTTNLMETCLNKDGQRLKY